MASKGLVKVGDVLSGADATTDKGALRLAADETLASGIVSEFDGQIVTMAINTPQITSRNTSVIGGAFRLDTRNTGGIPYFTVMRYAVGSGAAVNDFFIAADGTCTINGGSNFNGTAIFNNANQALFMADSSTGSKQCRIEFGNYSNADPMPNKIRLWGNSYGFSVASGTLEYLSGGSHTFVSTNGSVRNVRLTLDGAGNLVMTRYLDTAVVSAPAASNGRVWTDSTQKALGSHQAGIKQMLVGTIFTQTADATIVNQTNEVSLFGTGVGTRHWQPQNSQVLLRWDQLAAMRRCLR